MTRIALAGAALLLAVFPVMAQTTNDYTPAERARAERAARAAGFTNPTVLYAQAGTLFLKAQKGGKVHAVTVTANGRAYASTEVPAPATAKPS
jgi:hypothetical protein